MRSNLKVAMIADYPLDRDRIDGGVQAVVTYLVDALKDFSEIDLHIITFKRGSNRKLFQKRNGFYLHVLPKQRFGFSTFLFYDQFNLKRCLSRIKPHIVHAQGQGAPGYMALKSGYPAIVTFHGIIEEEVKYTTVFSRRIRTKLRSLLYERYCVKNASNTILISPYLEEYFGNNLQGTVHHIANPVKDAFFKLENSEEPGRILFAGRITPRKGVTDLLEALFIAKTERPVRLILAGSLSDSKYVQMVKSYVYGHGMENYVTFTDLLSESEILQEFALCSFLVLPSYQETAPMVIQQAMAAGKPVVASSICGIPHQVEDGATGLLFKPNDTATLSRHLEILLENHALRKAMGQKARQKAMLYYHANEVARETIRVYRHVLAGT
jgi:glycosyltransferase involved in cell wall biosynthesis